MRPESHRLNRITTAIALASALLFGLGVPGVHFLSGYARLAGETYADAEVRAIDISQVIGRNPDFWQFDGHALEAVLAKSDAANHAEYRRVTAVDGTAVYEYGSPDAVRWPSIAAVGPLFDSGVRVGTLEVRRSISPLVVATMLMVVPAFLVALIVFLLVRRLPMREMERAWEQASRDPLTGLPNRFLLNERIDHVDFDSQERTDRLTVLYLGLDNFKRVNDSFGFATGEEILRLVARRMVGCVRPYETVARTGGDEFAILLFGVDDGPSAAGTARRLIDTVSQPYDVAGSRVVVGLSVGIALPDGGEAPGNRLLRNAQAALYRAKMEGTNGFRFFDDLANDEIHRRQKIVAATAVALERHEFTLHYQPLVALDTGRIVGVEALLRWDTPLIRDIQTAIEIAEETGAIVPIGEYVLRRACTDAAAWPGVRVAVNVSPAQIERSDILAMVTRVLRETGLDPHRLELEITETALIERPEATLALLRSLQAMGIRIAMDDFGTGYSSLAYLSRFPFDKLKIDRSFLRENFAAENARTLIRGVIRLCDSLGIPTLAEGVETAEQAEWLAAEGCREAQGHFYAPALPVAEITALIAGFEARPRCRDDDTPEDDAARVA